MSDRDPLEEYKILREDKNHHDMLVHHFLYFYFAIAPLFLLVGVGFINDYGLYPLIFCIIFDILLGIYTLEVILNSRHYWNYDVFQAKKIEENSKLGIIHFSEAGDIIRKEYGKVFEFSTGIISFFGFLICYSCIYSCISNNFQLFKRYFFSKYGSKYSSYRYYYCFIYNVVLSLLSS